MIYVCAKADQMIGHNFTDDTLLKAAKNEVIENSSELNNTIRNQFNKIINEKIDYIKLVGSECPKQYPKNNWLRRHGQNTIGRKLRRKRKKEIIDFHHKVTFALIEETIDDILLLKIEDSFNNFVDYKNLAIGDENTYYIED